MSSDLAIIKPLTRSRYRETKKKQLIALSSEYTETITQQRKQFSVTTLQSPTDMIH